MIALLFTLALAAEPVAPGKFTVTGSLTAEDVKEVLTEHKASVATCWEKAVTNFPGLAGMLELRWVIAQRGNVRESRVTHVALASEAVEAMCKQPRPPALCRDYAQLKKNGGGLAKCLRGTVSRWVFPEPRAKGDVVVTYPFALGSKSESIAIEEKP